MRAGSIPAPLEMFFAHIGWNEFIRFHREFPLRDWSSSLRASDWHIGVTCTDTRTGEIVTLFDPEKEFPSPTLITSFRLLAGSLSGIMADNEKRLNRRTDRGRRR